MTSANLRWIPRDSISGLRCPVFALCLLLLAGAVGTAEGQDATIRAEFGSITVRAVNLDGAPVSWRTPVKVEEGWAQGR